MMKAMSIRSAMTLALMIPKTDDPISVQRREAFRLRARVPVRIERPVKHTCETSNLSVDGALLTSPLPGVTTGDEVSLQLDLGDEGRIELDATAVRCEQTVTALVFHDAPAEVTNKLQRYIGGEQRRILRLLRGLRRQQ